MFSGIVFDFDGVLYDSESCWAAIENPYLKRHIPEWENSNYSKLIGKALPEVYEYLVNNYGFSKTRKEYFMDYEEMAEKLYKTQTAPTPGLHSLGILLSGMSKQAAIASSSKREWIKYAMTHHPINISFNTIVSAHDVDIAHGKPAPDVYLRAAEKLHKMPNQLVAIEDSKNGISAARAAGMFCIGFRNGFNNDQDLSVADLIIDGFSDKSLAQIEKLLR